MVGGRGGAQTTKSFWKMGTKTEKKTGNAFFYYKMLCKFCITGLISLTRETSFPLHENGLLENVLMIAIQELQNCAIHTVMRIHSI